MKMPVISDKVLRSFFNLLVIGGLFILGLWLTVIQPMGVNLAFIPGDIGDVRFNNYVLEHFYRWVIGLDKSYWSPAIFYPFPYALAFSDNLLGSAPFFGLFRWAGLDRETAYQAWYILGFGLNYASAAYVLSRSRLKSLAVAAGAFYFSFGLPILAQETHPQLFYRCAIPLACLFLWQFARAPRLRWLLALAGMLVWQFYLGIYNGVFLFYLLVMMALLIPFCFPAQTLLERLKFWPRRLQQGWSGAIPSRRVFSLVGLAGLGASFVGLFWPYYQASKIYGLGRRWAEISSMLPRIQSYFLADNSIVWHSISANVTDLTMRHEHQLFPGLVALISLLLILGVFRRMEPDRRGFVLAHLGALGLLVAVTLYGFHFSLYRVLWKLPGLNSIRAVSRIILVMMWPLGVMVAFAIDALVRSPKSMAFILVPIALLLTALLVCESALYNHSVFSKADAQARLAELRSQIPAQVPPDPVLMVASSGPGWWANEIDAMLVGQDLGWPVFNGYSGNHPPEYGPTVSCALLPARIRAYMTYSYGNIPDEYLHFIARAVPLGFTDCDPAWWQKIP